MLLCACIFPRILRILYKAAYRSEGLILTICAPIWARVFIKGGTSMNANKTNECIQCTIKNCTHHADAMDYCTLDTIRIGTHEMNPTKKECTDCESFVNKMQ